PREETEDTKAFLAVLASFSELNGKKIFVMGPGRFISALSRETPPANVFPLSVDLNDGDWYTLDMHPNKQGHREMAAQILEQLNGTKKGRQCLGGNPCPRRCNSRSTSPWNSRGAGSRRGRRHNFSDPSESLGVRPRWAWPCRPRRVGVRAVRPRLDANRSSPFAAARSRRAKSRSIRPARRRSAGGWSDPAWSPN